MTIITYYCFIRDIFDGDEKINHLESVFGALVILSPDKREVLAVPQKRILGRSVRFPGTTVPIEHLNIVLRYVIVERIVRHDGSNEEILDRANTLFTEGLDPIEKQNWGPEVTAYFEDDLDLWHGKYFKGFVMTDRFDWGLVRNTPIAKPSDPSTSLEAPQMVTLGEFINPSSPTTTCPRAHFTVATKLQGILNAYVCFD